MSSAEFAATTPLRIDDHDAPAAETRTTALQEQARGLLRLSLRFDPYSATARADYDALKAELDKFDLLGLLREELSKSRVHISLTRKLVNALKYLDPIYQDDAMVSLMNNAELLYPIFPAVLTVAKTVFNDLSTDTQALIHNKVVELIESSLTCSKG